MPWRARLESQHVQDVSGCGGPFGEAENTCQVGEILSADRLHGGIRPQVVVPFGQQCAALGDGDEERRRIGRVDPGAGPATNRPVSRSEGRRASASLLFQ